MTTRRGQDYRENAAVAAAIAAVATANDATAATNMMDCHAGDLFSGGGGGETAIEAVNEAINVAIKMDYFPGWSCFPSKDRLRGQKKIS